VFFGVDDGSHPAGMTVNLPESGDHALSLPEGSPTGYGLGRAGWVTVTLTSSLPAREVLTDWIMESYRSVAPKSLAAKLIGDDR
jgi:predicted DNA-binding protein (MmcQ/YjbR family)